MKKDDNKEFYNQAWARWGDMIKYSPAPRIRREKIIKWLRDISPDSILDVGCGNGEFLLSARKALREAKLSGADISSFVIGENRNNLPGMSFYELDLNKGHLLEKFDAVVSMEVVEHCDVHAEAINRLAQMADKWLLITVPCGHVFEIDRRVGHIKHPSAAEVSIALERAGFEIVKLERWGFHFFNLYKWLINMNADKMCNSFLSLEKYNWKQKLLATVTYFSFRLSMPWLGYQLFVLAARK
jgi:SAM-dependent methyltransferase